MAEAVLPEGVQGSCHSRFAAVADLLGAQLTAGSHHGVAVAVRHRGEPVVDLWGGAFREDSLVVSFSTTKGPVAIALHQALERKGVGYDTPVAAVWPEFAAHGKGSVTIRQCLCHEAGVPQIRDQVDDVWALTDWDAMVAMTAGLEPLWEPGTANGYHAINWGWLAGELVRRIDGRAVDRFLAEEVAGPLGLDGCFLGVPDDQRHRVVPVALDPAYGALPRLEDVLPPDSFTVKSLTPRGDLVEFVNSAAGMAACVPAITGAFTARSLAAIYGDLERGGRPGGTARLLRAETVAAATSVQNTRPDLVLLVPMHWRLGFMSGGNFTFSHPGAYGHAGFGGSLAMADPVTELAVAVTVDLLSPDVLGDGRGRNIVAAAVAAVAG
ncbi:MAG: serine hydrolase domain-containing protein [Acidimicrobiales bacterium]